MKHHGRPLHEVGDYTLRQAAALMELAERRIENEKKLDVFMFRGDPEKVNLELKKWSLRE